MIIYFYFKKSVIQMGGFRSLGDDEEVEFKAVKSDKGLEAVEVRSSSGGDCKGSNRRPGAKKKHKKVRYQSLKRFLGCHVTGTNVYLF